MSGRAETRRVRKPQQTGRRVERAKTWRECVLARIHIAAKELGLEREEYETALEVATGKKSAKNMTKSELAKVLDQMNRLGLRGAKRKDRLPKTAEVSKIRALWISAYSLGVVENKTDGALMRFVKRQTGLDAAAWVGGGEAAFKVIEALKAWMARPTDQGGGGVDWTPHSDGVLRPRARVVEAQRRRLYGHGGRGLRPAETLSAKEADAEIRRLGQLIRNPLKPAARKRERSG